MAERSRNDGASSSLSHVGIPTGLNRIRTRRIKSNSGDEDSDQFNESPSNGFSISAANVKQKLKALSKGRAKFGRSKQGILIFFVFAPCLGVRFFFEDGVVNYRALAVSYLN